MMTQIQRAYGLCAFIVLIAWLCAEPAFAQSQHVAGPGLSGLTLRDDGAIYYKRDQDCAGDEFAPPCRIEHISTSPSAAGPVVDFVASNGTLDQIYSRHIAVRGDGQFAWLARTAVVEGAGADTLALRAPAGSSVDDIVTDNQFYFWSEGRLIYRVPIAGGTPALVVDAVAQVKQLRADGRGGVFYIGVLDAVHHTSPDPVTGVFVTRVGPGATLRYTFDDTHVYMAVRDTGVGGYTLYRAPNSNLAGFVSGAQIGAEVAGDTGLSALVVDEQNLYWYKQGNSADARVINRLAKTQWGVSSPTINSITPIIAGSVTDMVSNNDHLFYLSTGTIWRLDLATAAPVFATLTLDEVVINQGVSGVNSFILIENKKGVVWAEPRIEELSGIGQIAASVRIERRDDNGALVPPVLTRVKTLTGAAVNRDDPETLVMFDLPVEWTRGGGRLEASIRPLGVAGPVDTDTTILPVSGFRPKTHACIKFVPADTRGGTYRIADSTTASGFAPGFLDIWRRAETLYPVPEVRYDTTEHALGFLNSGFDLDQTGPLGVIGASALMASVIAYDLWDSPKAYCAGDNARSHYVAMVSPAARTRTTNNVNLLGTGTFALSSSWVKMTSGGSGMQAGSGGLTLVHEIGHNQNNIFGTDETWQHVGCNLPPGADFNNEYPYDYCTIGLAPEGPGDNNGTGSTVLFEAWGVDRLSGQHVSVTEASDYMSYRNPSWASFYRWLALMDKIEDKPDASRAAFAAADSVSDVFAIVGILTPAEDSILVLNSAFVSNDLGLSVGDIVTEATPDCLPSRQYAVQFLDAADAVLASKALNMACSGDAIDGGYYFALNSAVPSGTTRLVVRDDLGRDFWEQTVSSELPVVEIVSPQAGDEISGALTVAWQAEHPAGLPMTYIVQYKGSEDDEAPWRALATGLEEPQLNLNNLDLLTGSQQGRIRVLASDGFGVGAAVVSELVIPGSAPQAAILYPINGAMYTVDDRIELIGQHLDFDDVQDGDTNYVWTVQGPTTLTRVGPRSTLSDLPPGRYALNLAVSDDTGEVGMTTSEFVVQEKFVPTTDDGIMFNGSCDDVSYTDDEATIGVTYVDGSRATARFVRDAGSLYICVNDLRQGALAPPAVVTFYIDADASADNTVQTGDLQVRVSETGSVVVQTGSSGLWQTQSPSPSVEALLTLGDANTWTAEIRIDVDDLLDGWDHFAGVSMVYFDTGAQTETTWPVNEDPTWPATWGRFAFGGNLAQTVVFGAINDTPLEDIYVATPATATSGLSVTVTSQTPDVCNVDSDNVTHFVAGGLCVLEARQDGNNVYVAAVAVERSFLVLSDDDADSDGDGVPDAADNCTLVPNPGQVDADADGLGNACDADFNNDCLVNVVDLGLMRGAFFSDAALFDLNSDGVVNVLDLGMLRAGFFGSPGPSEVAQICQ